MPTHSCPRSRVHRVTVLVAALFGLLSIIAGGRVLLGIDPGYTAYRPLVVFNTLMGAVYIAAALVIRGSLRRGRWAAGGIALINVSVLVLAAVSRLVDGPVAAESVRAMVIRSLVWLGIFGALGWVARSSHARDSHWSGRAPALR